MVRPASAALFEPGRLTSARESRGLLKVELARAVGVTAAAIGQYESGVARPRPAILGRLAVALSVPPDFFAQLPVQKVAEQDVQFRRLRSASKRDRATALARLALLSQLVAHLEVWIDLPEVDLPTDLALEPDRAAAQLRNLWQLGAGPISSMTRLLEAHGVAITRFDRVSTELDAFSCWIGARPYVVLVGDKGDKARSRFDAAHELGHLLLHPDPHPGDHELEREAHKFAAAFLMPTDAIANELPSRVDWRQLLRAKLRWGVSLAALLMRAREIGRISDSAYKRAMVAMSRYQWRRHEPGELTNDEEPSLLRRAINLVENETSTSDVMGQLAWSESLMGDIVGQPRQRVSVRA